MHPLSGTSFRSRAATSRLAWRPRGLPALAALAIVLAVAAGTVGMALGGAGVAAAAAVPKCLATQLSARIVDWQGAAGSRIADVELTNTSFVHCSLRDFPQVQLVSARGIVLINGPAASTTASTHGLVQLGLLKTEVSTSNYCGPAYARPVTLAFVLPGLGGRVVAIPVSPSDSSGVPPCNGAPGSAGSISMHAWHG
jgi:hypothetical protein